MTKAIENLKSSENVLRKYGFLSLIISVFLFVIGFIPFKIVWVSSEVIDDYESEQHPGFYEYATEEECMEPYGSYVCELKLAPISEILPTKSIAPLALIVAGILLSLWISTRNSRLNAEAKQ